MKTVQKFIRPEQPTPCINLPKVAELFDETSRVVLLPNMPKLYTVLEWIHANSDGTVEIKTLNATKHLGTWYVLSCGDEHTFASFSNYNDYLRYMAKYGQ